MSIERLLQRPGVKKVVDPGTSGEFLEKIKEVQDKPSGESRNSPTPIPVIIQDLVTRAAAVETRTKAVLADIKAANYSDHTFKMYYDTLEAVQVTIDEVLKDPSKDLGSDKKQQEIKALERSVYLTSTDPRASFVQTLFDTLQQTGVIRALASKIWGGITAKTDLYDQYQDDPIARYAIWRVNSELGNLLGLVTGVEALRTPVNGGVLADALAELIVARSGHLITPSGSGDNKEPIESWNPISIGDVIEDLGKLGTQLKQLRVVLDLRKLDLAEHWEKLGENLKSTFQTVYRQFISEALSTLFFSLAGKVTDDLLELIDTLPLLSAAVHQPQVFHELIRQAEFGLIKVYQEIEGHVLGQERRTIEHRELTGLMLANALTVASVTGNLGAVITAIAQIDAVQQKLKAVGGATTVDLDSLRTYLKL